MCAIATGALRRVNVIDVPITATNMEDFLSLLENDLESFKGEYVCVSNAHTCVMAHDDPEYWKVQADSIASLPDGKPLSGIRDKDISEFRRDHLGFVFQEFNLLDTFNLKDNILLPLVLKGMKYKEMYRKLSSVVKELGIADLMEKYPYEVSGGQKQRAAVARALITDPRLILADEPTGALDSRATDELLALFEKINRKGQTILMVTHSVKAASRAGRVLFIKDGEVYHQVYRGGMTDEQLYQKISDTLTILATGGERR